MASKHRVFLTGSDRAEAEHVLGHELPLDKADPRFVLLTDEQEEAVRKLPAGIPPNRGQNWAEVAQIRAAELDRAGVDHELGDSGFAEAFEDTAPVTPDEDKEDKPAKKTTKATTKAKAEDK